MPIRKYKPTSPGRRHGSVLTYEEVTSTTPEKSLLRPLKKSGGRNNYGRITVRFRGGGHKRKYRVIDFKRNKDGIPAKVATIEYDPNRTCFIALLHYADGEKRYILAPIGLEVGQTLLSGSDAEPNRVSRVRVPRKRRRPGLPRNGWRSTVRWCLPDGHWIPPALPVWSISTEGRRSVGGIGD